MAWTEITRRKYRRDGLRYASDTTDAEWAVIEPHMPLAAHCGRPRGTSLREVVNAIFYIAQTGCQWRMLPGDFPPFTTVHSNIWVSRPKEFHLRPLPEPDVNLSAHPAPITQPKTHIQATNV